MRYIDKTPDVDAHVELIKILNNVSAEKIYVEIERARLARKLAKIKEEQGLGAEAADLMQEVTVETFGAMSKTEKIAFILKQFFTRAGQNLGRTKNNEDIYAVCVNGDPQTLKTLIEKHDEKYFVSQPNDNDYYPLQWVALNNHVHVALYILQHDGDVNAKGQGNQTALHWAGVRGSVEMAEFLLENGAKLEAEDVNCYRPKHKAA